MQIISNMVEAHIFRKKDDKLEFLLLMRANTEIYPGLWQMVSGKIKENEKAFQTVLRELKEETGLTPLKLWVAPNVNSFYSHERDNICFLPVFAVLVDENSEVKISEEHSAYYWYEPEAAKKLLAWPGQKKSVDIITEYVLKESSFLQFVEIKI